MAEADDNDLDARQGFSDQRTKLGRRQNQKASTHTVVLSLDSTTQNTRPFWDKSRYIGYSALGLESFTLTGVSKLNTSHIHRCLCVEGFCTLGEVHETSIILWPWKHTILCYPPGFTGYNHTHCDVGKSIEMRDPSIHASKVDDVSRVWMK